jgi:hypothetical protein
MGANIFTASCITLDEARTEWDVVVLYKLISTTVHRSGLFLRYRLERLGFAADHRPHSSSANRFTAGASGFLLLTQSGEQPDLYRESFRFETIPSRPSLQA